MLEYKINTLLPIQFEMVENPPYLNDSRFQAVKIYIAHEKENYNGSYFDMSVLQKMGSKMAGVPIVGYITADNANELDFNGHEQRLVIQDDEISIEYLGRAYGCILSNDDVSIVERMHEDGNPRKYLCATGVLWKMFTECVDIFDKDNQKGHSMELEENSIQGKFGKDGYYHFTDATIRALCILGDGVLPAMSNSIIEKFSAIDYQDQVQELLTEINESIKQFNLNQSSPIEVDNINFTKKEDNDLEEKLELIAKYNLTVEQLDFSIEEISLEELDEKLEDLSKKEEDTEVSFSATYNQKREALSNALDPIIVRDEENKIVEETYFWVADFDDEFVYVEKDYWNKNGYDFSYGRAKYTFDETTITAVVDMSSWERMINVWLTEAENQKIQDERDNVAAEYQKLKDEFEDYKNKYSTDNSEVKRLQQFEQDTLTEQRKQAEESLFSQFDEKLSGVEEYEKLKEIASEFELGDLQKECYVILGIQSANFSAKPKGKNKNDKVKLDFNKKIEKSYDSRNELFEKYLKKDN